MLVDRSRLRSDPASALRQTKAVARAINRIAPGQDYLIDNISNTLQVAKDDAAVAQRMFLFLGLPGALMAAFLAGWAGTILATTQRREWANLRIRGADKGHLLRLLAYRTLAFACVGSVLGVGLGLLSALVILGHQSMFESSAGDLLRSGSIAVVAGMATTALALYVPGRRSLSREVAVERGEMGIVRIPTWRRLRLDLVLLAAAAVAEVIAFRSSGFDAPIASVSAGESVALPSRLLVAPIIAWVGGVLFAVRLSGAVASRLPLPGKRRFGPVIRGTLTRSLRRRVGSLTAGIIGVGLVVAFGVALAMFAATYDAAKSADSRFAVGSDLRITPSVVGSHSQPPGYASKLRVPGVAAATPVVSKLENSVLIGPHNQDVKQLTAVDPHSFERVAALSDSFFVDRSAAGEMAALQADPRGLLVDSQTADDLQIGRGDRVQVLLARGTSRETRRTFHVVGLFDNFPGFPQGTNLVANLRRYQAATGSRRADFFLARTTDGTSAGLARTTAALGSGPGKVDPIKIDSTQTALNKDQSSLTALNVQRARGHEFGLHLGDQRRGPRDLRLRPHPAAAQGVRDPACPGPSGGGAARSGTGRNGVRRGLRDRRGRAGGDGYGLPAGARPPAALHPRPEPYRAGRKARRARRLGAGCHVGISACGDRGAAANQADRASARNLVRCHGSAST